MSGINLNKPQGPRGAARRSSRWKVTHIDASGRRHRTVLQAADNRTVAALAEAMYGEAMALSLVRMDRLDCLRRDRAAHLAQRGAL